MTDTTRVDRSITVTGYESHAWTLRTLAEAAGLGSNLLLNVDPTADGTLPERAHDRLEALAARESRE